MTYDGEPYFKNVPGMCDLFLECSFFDADYPVLFTCRDVMNNIYLCLCCDIRESQRWIISKTSSSIVIDMLSNKITVGDAFKSCTEEHYLIEWSNVCGYSKAAKVPFSDIDQLDLPMDLFLEVEEGEFDDYIDILSNLLDTDCDSHNNLKCINIIN